jgi:tripeptide aminopeptidase
MEALHDDGHRSKLARETAPDALERFLRYVCIDTRADPASTTVTSTRQVDLFRLLQDDLKETELADAMLDAHGYAMATLPATVEREVPAITLLAHVDVAPDAGTGMDGRDQERRKTP